MRYQPGHRAQTRARILAAAARCFREKGFVAASVDDVMAAAGLTAGAFYAHFASKEALIVETIGLALRESGERLFPGLDGLEGLPWLREFVRRYLSRAHRDEVAKGCALPTLTTAVARQGHAARKAFEEHLLELVESRAAKWPPSAGLETQDRALAVFALCAGGLMLARAVDDPALSDRILRACRSLATAEPAAPTYTPAGPPDAHRRRAQNQDTAPPKTPASATQGRSGGDRLTRPHGEE